MGYKPRRKTYNLQFEGGRFEGLEVTICALPIGELLELDELSETRTRENVDRMFEIVSIALQSWNLETEDDQPVPATKEGLYTQDPDFVHAIVDAWRDAMTGVSAPLPETSDAGETSPEASIPMEPLSPSLAS